MIDASQVSIIIPHLGSNKEQEFALEQCLGSLDESCDIEIIVVKNGEECKHNNMSSIRIYKQGQCAAVNAAVATTNTKWIMISNDDMVYAPGWFEKLQFPESSSDGMLCISPKLVEPRDGAPTFEKQMFGGAGGDFDKQKWLDFNKSYKGMPGFFRFGFNLPFLIKRGLWDTVGGYDINYDPWGSNGDSDLEYKIKLAGVQPYQNTNCIVYHFSQTSGTFHPDQQEYWNENWGYFAEKWGFLRTDEGIWEANFQIPTEGRKFRPEWEGKYAL